MTIQELEDKGLVLLRVIVGSQSYGTATPESDQDEKLIYMSPLENLLGLDFIEQVSENKNDLVGYELGRFMELLKTANPTVCEILFSNDNFILYKHPLMDELIKHRDKFITKKMKNTFAGYASSQIKKADSLGKKMNWEKDKVTRKGILDFCYTPFEQGSQHIIPYLNNLGLKQEYCGLASLNNMRFTFTLYYDYIRHIYNERPDIDSDVVFGAYEESGDQVISLEKFYKKVVNGKFTPFLYKGIVQDIEKSNDLSLSSIPKNEKPLCIIQFNKDAYQQHCRAYKEYQTWLKERNTARYTDINEHGQSIDGKNLLHCVRLLRMSKEIASGKGIIVDRTGLDAEYLLSIRKGKQDLKKLIEECEIILKSNDKLFEKSNLPEQVDSKFVNDLLVSMRKQFYKIK